MPPRKKLKSSAKKSNGSAIAASNQQSQSSKFGIQHFFERHSHNALSSSQLNPKPTSACAAVPDTIHLCNSEKAPGNVADSASERVGSADSVVQMGQDESQHTSQKMPSQNYVAEEVNAGEERNGESPTKSSRRFKFSPGMLIKQSQDDGGDEVTWRISPVNEKLRATSKQIPKTIKALADSSKLTSVRIRPCSQNKGPCSSPGTASKVEKWLSSPSKKASGRCLVPSKRVVGVRRENACMDTDSPCSFSDTNDSSACQNSPFQTPPSLPYSDDKFDIQLVNATPHNGTSDQPGCRKYKKALLDLLDQVEVAISVDDSLASEAEAQFSSIPYQYGDEMPVIAKDLGTNEPAKLSNLSASCQFLVLEVSEKCQLAESLVLQSSYKVLRLLNELSGDERAVYLWDEWYYSVVSPGDSVNVIGKFDDEGKCDVDRENNFLIIHPDILVSGTRVAASFSCPRRSILDERLKSNEPSAAALMGTLLHQLFQAGLMKDVPTVNFLEEYAITILHNNIENLYACGVNDEEMQRTLFDAIPRIIDWIAAFRDSQAPESPIVNFGANHGSKKVNILEVIDIEEMSWAPKYGIKGMIDASIRVAVESKGDVPVDKIMPVEFKTGKPPNGQSMEHCAQVILYTLLMSERYLKHIDTGLLYYLQSNQTQGIAVQRRDLVGLIMRRNELANDILNASKMQKFPPMIQSPSMCRSCRHLDVCTIYHKAHGGSMEASGLGDVFEKKVNHMSISHCNFLRQWERLVDLEAREIQLVKNEIFRAHGSRRDHSAGCLSSLVLDTSDGFPHQISHNKNRFVYRFVRQDLSPASERAATSGEFQSIQIPLEDLDCKLRSGDYVMLSSESRQLTVASGFIRDISHLHVSVSLSRRLRLPGSQPSSEVQELFQEVWRIDKDEVMTSFSVMRFNIMQLFLQNARSAHLRKMIVDLEVPRFDSGSVFSQDPAVSYILSERSLNDDQRQAIIKILTAKDYALILGMPGTGKTSTMVHAVKALLIRGSSILLASYTNSAVDNLLIKLKAQGVDFLRVGRYEACHEEVRSHCFAEMNVQDVYDIKTKLEQVKVVAVTCLGITSPLLSNKRFDVCIVDEAGQVTLPVSLGPLMFASTFVLVGDHYQLPPLVQSTEARENGMGVSLFCRLSEAYPQAISALRSQYRMCQGIMELSNALIYGDRLCCGSTEVANAKLELATFKSCSSWLKEVLDPSRPVIFVDTDVLPAFETREQETFHNPIESRIIAEIAAELVNNGIKDNDIGIITPYNSQTSLIRKAFPVTSVEIHTIDKYQGRDKDCILVSFVRSTENPRSCASSLLGDWHRINVALTRAKKKLIMVGSRRTLSKVPLLMLMLGKVEEQSGILCVSRSDIKLGGELKRCSGSRRM